jgi:uncharacterized protein YbaP (TraB family)
MLQIGFFQWFRSSISRPEKKANLSDVRMARARWPLSRQVKRLFLCGFAATLGATVNALPTMSKTLSTGSCASQSVLYDLDHTNRQKLERILDDASRIQNGDAVLWRIDKDGLAPSYLFGTVHVLDPTLQDLSPAVRSAIDQSKTVAVESIETSRSTLVAAMGNTTALMVSPDRELQRVLDEDEMAVVEKAFRDAGYPEELAVALKPWAVTMFLADSQCQKTRLALGLKPIDMIVAERARSEGKSVVGLETLAEQYRSLASISDVAQVAWLKASIDLHDRVDDISETLSELYRFRRLNAVWPITRELAPDAGLDDSILKTLQDELISKRNARMLARATPLLDKGGVFIAVGALHQSGPNGLVALLRKDGFSVTAIE